jgi:hypothetical protein
MARPPIRKKSRRAIPSQNRVELPPEIVSIEKGVDLFGGSAGHPSGERHAMTIPETGLY